MFTAGTVAQSARNAAVLESLFLVPLGFFETVTAWLLEGSLLVDQVHRLIDLLNYLSVCLSALAESKLLWLVL